MTTQEALFKYCLRLGDNSLILSQRLAEWTSHGPYLEEDLALTNIALDILGQAKSILDYAGIVEGKNRTADDLVYFRNEREFYNTLLVEQPNGDYAKTIARQLFVDAFELNFYTELSKSKDETLAAIATKSLKEVKYHLRHSLSWFERFGDGTEESHARLQNGVNELWRFTDELFEMNEVDDILLKDGIAVDLNHVKTKWNQLVQETCERSKIQIPENTFMQRGSRKAIHSEHLGYILSEMQYVARMHPGAKW